MPTATVPQAARPRHIPEIAAHYPNPYPRRGGRSSGHMSRMSMRRLSYPVCVCVCVCVCARARVWVRVWVRVPLPTGPATWSREWGYQNRPYARCLVPHQRTTSCCNHRGAGRRKSTPFPDPGLQTQATSFSTTSGPARLFHHQTPIPPPPPVPPPPLSFLARSRLLPLRRLRRRKGRRRWWWARTRGTEGARRRRGPLAKSPRRPLVCQRFQACPHFHWEHRFFKNQSSVPLPYKSQYLEQF